MFGHNRFKLIGRTHDLIGPLLPHPSRQPFFSTERVIQQWDYGTSPRGVLGALSQNFGGEISHGNDKFPFLLGARYRGSSLRCWGSFSFPAELAVARGRIFAEKRSPSHQRN